jgi:hypothetical protein
MSVVFPGGSPGEGGHFEAKHGKIDPARIGRQALQSFVCIRGNPRRGVCFWCSASALLTLRGRDSLL